jgi:hypothetical protein
MPFGWGAPKAGAGAGGDAAAPAPPPSGDVFTLTGAQASREVWKDRSGGLGARRARGLEDRAVDGERAGVRPQPGAVQERACERDAPSA